MFELGTLSFTRPLQRFVRRHAASWSFRRVVAVFLEPSEFGAFKSQLECTSATRWHGEAPQIQGLHLRQFGCGRSGVVVLSGSRYKQPFALQCQYSFPYFRLLRANVEPQFTIPVGMRLLPGPSTEPGVEREEQTKQWDTHQGTKARRDLSTQWRHDA